MDQVCQLVVQVVFAAFKSGHLGLNGIGVHRTHDGLSEVLTMRDLLTCFVVLEEEREKVRTCGIVEIRFAAHCDGFFLTHKHSPIRIVIDREFDMAIIRIPPFQ